MELASLIDALARPGALVPGETPAIIQTHISVVFLTSERAFKIKKPIQLWGFLDYGTLEARKHWCEEEVRLNRRLAPDLYLGVEPITETPDGLAVGGAGAVVEYAVLMRRLKPGVTLLERLGAGTLEATDLEATGRALAAFQAEHRLGSADAQNGLPARLGRTIQANFRGSAAGMPDPFPPRVHEGVRTRIFRRLWRARGRMRRRVRRGLMTDGHGDIRLEHVIREEGRTNIMDCCEFSPTLRHIDPLSDAAFLSMDLIVRGRPDLATAFEQAYLAVAGDSDAPHLLPLYRAYRAHVRAMVDEQSLRAAEVPADVKAQKALGARRTLALAWTQARTGAIPPIIVLRGAAGVGKSWLATRIAPWLGADIIRSDVVRKELLDMDPTWRPDAAERGEVYGAAMHERTYRAVLVRAGDSVAAGRAAILDATYLRKFTRVEVREYAQALGAPYAVLNVTCDPDVVRQRLIERARRNDDASDADQAIYDEMMRTAEPLDGDEAHEFASHASGSEPEHCVLALLDVLERQLDAGHERLGPETPRPEA